ncbi:MAG TPA: 2-succinyl-5-enolpyruvyl-6-hydroxy-3-cyclohexene-1-carboxylic-acid synthase, partial [Actinomycetota bacterium]|nr:2-succinyl-5-enolpyruvyl-6-hydroxy-3-cyclohexene-1-carboxylic-acid synthase [Actinomycetota bacterium]
MKGAGNAMAAAVVDELTRHGVVTAVFGPGSRSTPLVLALDAHPQVKLHVAVDERSAGFVAVGAARASGMPAIVLTTSGTAAANLHPAILEAHHSRLPLIAITADRPPELRDTGAGQTIDQIKMFGDSVRWFCEAGVADGNMDLVGYSRSIASRAFAEAVGSPRGPVHLNLAFREPFIAESHDEEVDISGRPEG